MMIATLPVMPAKWRFHSGSRVRLCEVRGLPSSYSDPHALIDTSIAELVAMLNANGFRTRYCCSGLAADHKRRERHAYIAFTRPIPRAIEKQLPPAAYVDREDHRMVIRMTRESDDAARTLAWKLIEEAFVAYFANL